MIVKGHHFPNVTLVGVMAADSSLNIDDYRANERTFDILTQVAGRAGREKLEGKVIIQTYNPENFSIECAKKQDYKMFYKTEILLREQLKYPPFLDICLIRLSSADDKEICEAANFIYKYLKENITNEEINILKPMPSPILIVRGKYRWRIIIKGTLDEVEYKVLNNAFIDFSTYFSIFE